MFSVIVRGAAGASAGATFVISVLLLWLGYGGGPVRHLLATCLVAAPLSALAGAVAGYGYERRRGATMVVLAVGLAWLEGVLLQRVVSPSVHAAGMSAALLRALTVIVLLRR